MFVGKRITDQRLQQTQDARKKNLNRSLRDNPNVAAVAPVKQYKPFQQTGLGPLATIPANETFYDLIMKDEYKEIRDECFEDWVFPEFTEQEGKRYMLADRCISHGFREKLDDTSIIGQGTVTQYIYVCLNLMKMPIQSFGSFPGQEFKRSYYLVCCEAGDPRVGNVGSAFIQYALPLNTPIPSAVELVSAVPYQTGNPDMPTAFQYLFNVKGDQSLEEEIFNRWFNSEDYFFNSVIYPKVRQAMRDTFI